LIDRDLAQPAPARGRREVPMSSACKSLSSIFGLAVACLVGSGCDVTGFPLTDPGQTGNNLQQSGGATTGDGSVRNVNQITDGTSNTITTGETSPPANNGGLSRADLDDITNQLGDKDFSFDSSTGNSDNNAFLSSTTEIA